MKKIDHKLDGIGFIPEFYVIDKHDRFFAGYRFGDFFFSEDPNEARTLNHPEQLKTINRHYPELKVSIFDI